MVSLFIKQKNTKKEFPGIVSENLPFNLSITKTNASLKVDLVGYSLCKPANITQTTNRPYEVSVEGV